MAGRALVAARLRCVLVLCLLLAGTAQAADGRDAFAAGVQASQAGDHGLALERFRAARAAGLDTPALDFNLGVTLFRLGQVRDARAAFRRAYRAPRLAGPAAYQLGRIARARGDGVQAAEWFRRAARAARTDRLRQRAWADLAELDVPAPRLYARVAIGGGFDSNATQAPDDVAGRDRDSDVFAALDAFAEYRLDAGLHLFGSLRDEEFASESDSSVRILRGGVGWREGPATWRRDARLSLRWRQLDGETFERALLADGGATRALGAGELRIGAGVDAFQGRSGFGFLDGERLRANARWRLPAQGGRWTLHGRVARVDRDDNAAAGFFASFSYDAIGVGVSHRRHVGGGRFLELDGHWRGTRYADEEVRAGATLDRRRESTVHLGGALEIPLGSRWQLITRLEGTRRTSSVDRFAYEQVRASAMIEREF